MSGTEGWLVLPVLGTGTETDGLAGLTLHDGRPDASGLLGLEDAAQAAHAALQALGAAGPAALSAPVRGSLATTAARNKDWGWGEGG